MFIETEWLPKRLDSSRREQKKNAKKIKRDINPMRIGNSTDVKYENLNSFQTYRIALQKIICDNQFKNGRVTIFCFIKNYFLSN